MKPVSFFGDLRLIKVVFAYDQFFLSQAIVTPLIYFGFSNQGSTGYVVCAMISAIRNDSRTKFLLITMFSLRIHLSELVNMHTLNIWKEAAQGK